MFIMACLLALTDWTMSGVNTLAAQTTLPDSAFRTKKTEASAPLHDPNKALLLSVLPGAGQVYNGQAWKVPIIYGAFAGVGYLVYQNYTNMRDFKAEYLRRAAGENA